MSHRAGREYGRISYQFLTLATFVLMAVVGGMYNFGLHQRNARLLQNTAHRKATPVTKSPPDVGTLPERFHDDIAHYSLSYPAGWQKVTTQSGSDRQVVDETTLTSPTVAVVLHIKFQVTAVSPVCIPDYYDKPFLTTNRCYSAEYLTADQLPVSGYGSTVNNVEPSQWFVTRYHFKSTTINATELYATCLVLGKPPLRQPQMGFLADHPLNHLYSSDGNNVGYFAACADNGNQIMDYNKPEAIVAEAILRSLRFD
ncbi:MAG: hypothetical protein NVS1B7_7490 [Candidatus Saccharimonadales bacterium]